MIIKIEPKPPLQTEWRRHFCLWPRVVEDCDSKFFVWLSFVERMKVGRFSTYVNRGTVYETRYTYRLPRKSKVHPVGGHSARSGITGSPPTK